MINELSSSQGSLRESQRFQDPIQFEEFTIPVVAPDGWTYNLSTIVEWLKKGGGFLPQTRQPILDEVVLYPNFSLAQDMMESGLLKVMPFEPGQAWSFKVNMSNQKAQTDFKQAKLGCRIYSIVDAALNAFCIYLAYNNRDNLDEVISNIALVSSCSNFVANMYSFNRLNDFCSPYSFRNTLAINIGLNFITSIANVAFVAYLASTNEVGISSFVFLSPIPKILVFASHLLSEIQKYSFFEPAKQNQSLKLIEIV